MSEEHKKYFKNIKASSKNPDSKQSIFNDKWDRKRHEQVSAEIKELVIANQSLGKKVPTGFEAMSDMFYALMKAYPELKDSKKMRPSFLINHAVMEEAMGLPEYEELRQTSAGDPISSALACIAMEEPLELIFDKFKEAQKQAQELEKMLQQMEQLEQDKKNLDEILSDVSGDESGDSDGESSGASSEAQKELIEQQMKMLQEQIDEGTESLEQSIEEELPYAMQSIKGAVSAASDAVSGLSSDAWGLQPGGLKKLPAAKRIELAKKLNSPQFRKMADIIGRIQRMAIAEQHNQVLSTQDEIYDVELGSDLHRLLPSEFMLMNDPVYQYDWLRRFAEGGLSQYSLKGQDKVAKGGIFICEDGSGSMSGSREIYAKGVGLALLKVAMMQKRPFYAIHFGGTQEYKTFKYDTSSSSLKLETGHRKRVEHFSGVEAVIKYAETFFNGGTDYMTPLSVALTEMQKEYAKNGAVQSDIVFLTDGQCGVHDSFMKTFKAEQAKLGFRIFGINIGGHKTAEPLHTICDGNVIVPKDLVGGSDIKEIFGAI